VVAGAETETEMTDMDRFSTSIGAIARVRVVTPEIEAKLAGDGLIEVSDGVWINPHLKPLDKSDPHRKAGPRYWRQLRDSRKDSYVNKGTEITELDAEVPAVTVDDTDGTVAFAQQPMEQSGVFEKDADGDYKMVNGVRLAWWLENRRGVQHGRIRNIGGNLCLMPAGTGEKSRATRMERALEAAEAKGDGEMKERLLSRLEEELAEMEAKVAAIRARMKK